MTNSVNSHPECSGSNPEFGSLFAVCSLLNKHRVKYIVCGAFACIHHGLVRTTEDVDILIAPDPENCRRVIDALSELPDHAAAELTVKDLLENVVVKVADAVEVDVSKSAWSVSYEEAIENVESVMLGGIKIPFLSLPDLIKSKDTYREKDRLDLISLKAIRERKGSA
jgi:hypothetical protein